MRIDPASLTVPEVYRLMTALIVPRPIAWVSTLSAQGAPNLAPFSYFMGVGSNPPALAFSPVNRRDGSKKDTLRNIEDTGEFVVCIVPFRLAAVMNATSADLPHGEDEFAHTGLTPAPSEAVKPPGVAESPARMECRLLRIVPVGEGPLAANVVIGQVLRFHLDDEVAPGGLVDAARLDAVARMGGDLYSRTTDRFELKRPKSP